MSVLRVDLPPRLTPEEAPSGGRLAVPGIQRPRRYRCASQILSLWAHTWPLTISAHLLQKADGSCSTDFKTTRSREQVIRVFEEFVQGDAEVLVSVGSQNPEMLGSLIPRGAPRSGHLTQHPSVRDPHPSVYRTALLLLYNNSGLRATWGPAPSSPWYLPSQACIVAFFIISQSQRFSWYLICPPLLHPLQRRYLNRLQHIRDTLEVSEFFRRHEVRRAGSRVCGL